MAESKSNKDKDISKLDRIEIQSPNKPRQFESMKKLKSSSKIQTPLKGPEPQKEKQSTVLYEETYYLNNLKENYLVLISDSLHIIQLPVGLLKTNVSIGDPIKLKLQFDAKRAESDRKKIITIQENLLKQLTDDDN